MPYPHLYPHDVIKGVASRRKWLPSWPLIVGSLVYILTLSKGNQLLLDGDTYWHIATGRWIIEHRSIPRVDPFSHSMPGAAWTAHEWLSEVVFALAHNAGSWLGVAIITALAFAMTIALLTRALLNSLEPIYALLLAILGVAMTSHHLLARPHILAMPLMLTWVFGLVRACDLNRPPTLWLIPVMIIWANLHGGFTLGLALSLALASEALLTAKRERRLLEASKSWGIFIALAAASSLITPHGIQGIWYTWETLVESSYALQTIREWQSPNFHKLQPLEFWLLGGLAFAMHQGLRLPPVRLILLLGFLHLALKHVRYVELVGLLAPLVLASPLAMHWKRKRQFQQYQVASMDYFFQSLARPAGKWTVAVMIAALLSWTIWVYQTRPLNPPKISAPVNAIEAVKNSRISGPVFNHYGWGGYLIYQGIPPFIDGRSDMYKDDFLRRFIQAQSLSSSDALKSILQDHQIQWTLLSPGTASVTLLDHLPDWRRFYSDDTAVVHIKLGANMERR